MGRCLLAVSASCLLWTAISSAQVAVSAKSGMINYVEGTVLSDGQPVVVKVGNFPQMQNGSELRTQEGRAEVLLSPGVVMRLGENSAVRMVSDDLMDIRIEFLAGSAVVEIAELEKGQALTITANGAAIGLLKKGLYRLDSEPPQVSVYDGEAWVTIDGQAQLVKHGRRRLLSGLAVAEKFDVKAGDALFRWAQRRSEYIALANISAARTAARWGYLGVSMWTFNPFYGTYTYLPGLGFYSNYWGCEFYGPGTVYFGNGYETYWHRPPNGSRHFGTPGRFGSRPERGRPGHTGFSGGSGHLAGDRPGGGGSQAGSGPSAGARSTGGGGHGWSGGSGRSGGGWSGGGHSAGGGGHSGGYSGGGGGHSSGGGYSGGGGGGGGHSSGGGGGGGGASNTGRGK